jgi:hypothetical protein
LGAAQVPAPSQRELAIQSVPSHFAGAQVTALSAMKPTHLVGSVALHVLAAQAAPAPSSHAVRAPWGAPFTGMHLPTLPSTSHASHCPSHAVSQHTPSTQLPLPHSSPMEHLVESFFLQVPSDPATAHEEPSPQLATPQQTPSVQKPVEQSLAVAHTLPSPSAGAHAEPLQ